ncbi:hypothetical protein C8D89_11533 [Actinomycetospora cinnamomea]|uniref:Uncharacterized protein n=1 Tax=Actinomycetospora cinnamomea TaxID=663609 RepID=A0A2U1EZH8_9PSEU|nr:hypothetical protein C8D89_11533 [Actinomycetospora cinnamomea]
MPLQILEGDVLFIEWSAISAKTKAMDGIDTFVLAGDFIRVQTVRYTSSPRSADASRVGSTIPHASQTVVSVAPVTSRHVTSRAGRVCHRLRDPLVS